jgi:hypothetical protein
LHDGRSGALLARRKVHVVVEVAYKNVAFLEHANRAAYDRDPIRVDIAVRRNRRRNLIDHVEAIEERATVGQRGAG